MRKFITHTDRVHSVHLPRVLIETAVSQGAPRAALFEDTNLTPEMLANPDMRISYLEYSLFVRNALLLTKNPALGLDVGKNTGLSQMGIAGFVIQNSPTLGAALETALRYSKFVAPGWDFTLDRLGDKATLRVKATISMDPFHVFAHEVVIASWSTQSRALSGLAALPVTKVRLPYPEPEHSKEYERFYDVPFSFDEAVAEIDFDAGFLKDPVPFADPATAKLAEQYATQLLPAEQWQTGLVTQMQRLLDNSTGVPPTLEEIAQKLQTSTRTLRRELANLQTSYHELLDESRRVRAEQWMATNPMPIERLAAQLGFSHVRSFRRAFKRWTGRTPGEARGK